MSTNNAVNNTYLTLMPTGAVMSYAGISAPTSWLLCYGQEVSRTTYASLFSAIASSLGTFTITIAAPAVITKSGHGLRTGDQVYFTTTGALPTGISANTIYYIHAIDSNTFHVATTQSNSYSATYITTTGSQSGTHTVRYCPYGLGDGSTTFNLPDMRGRVIAGKDDMGGTAASRLTLDTINGVRGTNLGNTGGEQSNSRNLSSNGAALLQVSSSFLGGRFHSVTSYSATAKASSFSGASSSDSPNLGVDLFGTTDTGNNTQPSIVVNYIIKT